MIVKEGGRLVVAGMAIGIAGAAAMWSPARRAARVSPLEALRAE